MRLSIAARSAVRFASSRAGNAVAAASTSEANVVLDVLVEALGPQSEASSTAARISVPLALAPRPTVASFGSVEQLVTLSGEEKDAGGEEDADADDLGELDLGDLEGLDTEGGAAPAADYVAELLKGRNFTPQEVRALRLFDRVRRPRSRARSPPRVAPPPPTHSPLLLALHSLTTTRRTNSRGAQTVKELDRHIVGQDDAKRAVAIALRNRWRRMHVSDELQQEVMPKSILMIGPTGCGKTEIARRLAGICDAPFVKVEATKFTEVGFHGRDVDMIIRDLVEASLLLTKKQKRARMMPDVVARVEDRILDSLTGKQSRTETRETFLRFLRNGSLEQREIEIEIPAAAGNPAGGPGAVVGFDPSQQGSIPLNEIIGKIGKAMHGGRTERKTMTVAEARKALEEVELEKLTDDTEMAAEAIANVEQNGIVVIDEIDKICSPEGDRYSGDASAEGVQRDLLPLVEGSIVSTKHGNVNTDFILFICAGAFHHCKPSDLLPELQGRLPIRVELKGLTQVRCEWTLRVPLHYVLMRILLTIIIDSPPRTIIFDSPSRT